MNKEFLQEFSELESMFDDSWLATDAAETLQKHTSKNMVPSKLVTPNDKYKKRSEDKEGKVYRPLIKNQPIVGTSPAAMYQEACKRYLNLSDMETLRVSASAIHENDQNKILTALTSKLYDSIVDKVDDIDFGEIPKSKGDITKIPNFDKVINCIQIIKNIIIQYKQKPDQVNIIETAIANVKARKDLFERCFRYGTEMGIILYNSICLGIVSSLSLLIATCIEFIKAPGKDEFQVSFDNASYNRTKDHLLFENLDRFNKACIGGSIDNALNSLSRNHMKNFTGAELGFFAGGLAIVAIILNIVPIMRELIFFFYYSRTRVSDYFEMQADLLQMNAHNLEMADTTHTSQEKERIVKRQLKVVELFRKVAEFFRVASKKAEVDATKEIANSNKKYKTSELMDDIPDSASSALF